MVAIAAARRRSLFLALVAALYAGEFYALHRLAPHAGQVPLLPWAAVTDLVVLPLVLYGLCFGWRRLVAPAGDLLPALLLVAGALALRFAVPPAARLPGPWLEAIALLAELSVLARVLPRVGRIRAAFRRHRAAGEGVFASLDLAYREFLPPGLARYLALESTVLATILAYRRMQAAEAGGATFRYVDRGAVGPIYLAVAVMGTGETLGLHVLLLRWLPPAWHPLVWVLTALGAYTLLWLLADYLAMRLWPHRVAGGYLDLRLGLRRRARVALDLIEAAAPYKAPAPTFTPRDRVRLAGLPPSLAPAATEVNVLLTFAAPVTIESAFGRPRQTTRLAIAVDDPRAFLAALRPPGPGPVQ